MRILFVMERKDITGGMQHSIHLLITCLKKEGMDIGILLPEYGVVSDFYSSTGARIFVTRHINDWHLSARTPFRNLSRIIRFRQSFLEVIDEFAPDIIHTHHLPSTIYVESALAFSNITTPRVFTQRGNLYAGISRLCLSLALKKNSKCIATTDYQKSITRQLLHVDDAKMVLIPNGTDIHLLSSARDMRSEWSVHDDEILYGIVGSPCINKSQLTLIQAVDLLKSEAEKLKFVIVGKPIIPEEEVYYQRLQDEIRMRKLEDKVIMAGYCKDIRSVMDAIDVLVSVSLREGFGRTIIESWACRKPVISTDIDGPKCIISEGVNGYLIPTETPDCLSEAILKMKDPVLRRRMGEAGYQEVLARYDAQQIARQHIALYSQVLQKAKRKNSAVSGC